MLFELNPTPATLAINIGTESAAFDGDKCGLELARILHAIADKLIDTTDKFEGMMRLCDTNGKMVGIACLWPRNPEQDTGGA